MIFEETYRLSNGVEIPKLGLGTWLIDDGISAQAVRDAVEIGYRHIDTAQAYGNEKGVGEGVRTCGIDREKIFVTTKLGAEIKDYKNAVKSIDDSLKRAGLEYFDMMIIHSPEPWQEFHGENHYFEGNRQAWKALEEAYKVGKLRAIGVSNFLEEDIDNIYENCEIKPVVNQILCHITNTPHELIKYSESKGLLIEAYSPIAHGEILRNPNIALMAEKYGVTVPQLCVRYTIQLGAVSLPKSANPEHIRENAGVEFSISDEDMEILKDSEKISDYGKSGFFPVFSQT